MAEDEFLGRLVYLTAYYDQWIHERNKMFKIAMINRIAKVIKVLDWGTEEGKLILEERERSGKWKDLESKDFKYILKVFHPDITYNNIKGISAEEMVPRFYPKTEYIMFDLIPESMLKVMLQTQKEAAFKITKKDVP